MLKQIWILILLCLTSICAFAQTEKSSAPIKWESYKVSGKDVSVLFPKLPILIQDSNICSEEETNKYTAYADETVYGLTIVSKNKQRIPDYCSPKKKFDEKNFDDRVSAIKTQLKDFDETKFNQNNFEVIKIKGTSTIYTYWLINDFSNKRWFELWVVNGNEDKAEVKNFVESIKTKKNPQGIEIGNGSVRTLGDERIADANVNFSSEKNVKEPEKEVQSLRIVVKPRPPYTDTARQAQVQGKTSMRVTFLANGGIGSVTPISLLPNGLTEQAVAAAHKIVFIPAKRNGKTFSVVKIVEYNFTLY